MYSDKRLFILLIKNSVDLFCDISHTAVQIVSWTLFVCIITVNRHIGAVKVINAFVFVVTPYKLFDTVSLAYISHEFDSCIIRRIRNGVRCIRIRCYLDRNSTVVVLPVGAAP